MELSQNLSLRFDIEYSFMFSSTYLRNDFSSGLLARATAAIASKSESFVVAFDIFQGVNHHHHHIKVLVKIQEI